MATTERPDPEPLAAPVDPQPNPTSALPPSLRDRIFEAQASASMHGCAMRHCAPGIAEYEQLTWYYNGLEQPLGSERVTRHLFSATSCRLCGQATIEAITSLHEPVASGAVFAEEVIHGAPAAFRSGQDGFEQTGALHTSALFDREGELLALREDVGRHSALDMVPGRALPNGMERSNSFVLMSGRLSFELLQKALAARIPLVAGICAPFSLAVEFAEESNQSVGGFLRPPRCNVYAGADWLEWWGRSLGGVDRPVPEDRFASARPAAFRWFMRSVSRGRHCCVRSW